MSEVPLYPNHTRKRLTNKQVASDREGEGENLY